jgi:hypothetical protein
MPPLSRSKTMGDNQTGGGGSVQWRINARKPKRHHSSQQSGTVSQSGADNGGQEGDLFTVTVRLPAGSNIEAFRESVRDVGNGKVAFDLTITTDPDQIVIKWPD